MIQRKLQHEEEYATGPAAPRDPRAMGQGQRLPQEASSTKAQAPSHKRQAHGSLTLKKVSRTCDRGARLR